MVKYSVHLFDLINGDMAYQSNLCNGLFLIPHLTYPKTSLLRDTTTQ